MTDQNNAQENFANAVFDQIIEQIFQPAAAGETVSDYFVRLGIDPRLPPVEFMKVLERVKEASVQLSHVNVWVIAMRFTAILFAMRDKPQAQLAIAELAKTMPEFPLQQLMDQPPTEYAKEILHPESAEARAFQKIDTVLQSKITLEPATAAAVFAGAGRPMRQILHVQVGNDRWDPTTAELSSITESFQTAMLSPHGGIVATRDGVKTSILDTDIDASNLVVSVLSKKEGDKEETFMTAATIPSSLIPKDDSATIKRTWEIYKETRQLPCSVIIDESGFFDVDADGNRFPLYVATPAGREKDSQ